MCAWDILRQDQGQNASERGRAEATRGSRGRSLRPGPNGHEIAAKLIYGAENQCELSPGRGRFQAVLGQVWPDDSRKSTISGPTPFGFKKA